MNKTLILGTALIDHLIYSPDSLEESLCNKLPNIICGGGSMRNVAYNLGILKIPVDFLAVWGNDYLATQLKKELNQLNIKTFGPSIDYPTPIFTFIETSNHSYAISSIISEFYLNADYQFSYQDYDYIITDCNDEALLNKIISLNQNIKFIFVGFLPATQYQNNTFGIVINRSEFSEKNTDEDLTALKVTGDYWLVITLDTEGLHYYYRHQNNSIKNVNKTDKGYPVGCGDALVAGLVYQLFNHQDFLDALHFGHRLAESLFLSPRNTIDSSFL